MAFLITKVTERAIDLFYEARGGEGPSPECCPVESARLYEWILEEGKWDEFEKIVLDRFPHGADRLEYYKYFWDEWKEIARKIGCPAKTLSK